MLLTAYMLEKTAIFGRSAFALMIITKKQEEKLKQLYTNVLIVRGHPLTCDWWLFWCGKRTYFNNDEPSRIIYS